MRRFHFGALSSSENLEYSRMMWPCAEMEAPYANSLLRLTMRYPTLFKKINKLQYYP